ncbi:minor extracellular protease Epr [Cohnella sp. OV330]|uniref:S8 family peptidase n=1 Tax=Cohnella sp. OV330 TaxID=1855288 RepID=UPI0008F43BF3|nr:S8 family peptidase [Cohnella sp. OV330]SFB19340.1 minor extracellular protease Epr [Cohnella sp. OV330]
MKETIRKLARQMKAGRKSPGRTTRSVIVLKHKKGYDDCIRHLKAAGIRPVKAVRRCRLIGCEAPRGVDWKALKRHPSVAYIEKDRLVKAHGRAVRSGQTGGAPIKAECRIDPAKIPWNIARIEAPPVWKRTKGQCAKLAVVDTGIGPNPDLTVAGGVNTIDGGSFKDDNGHGTHVAGIAAATGRKRIYGAAPRVRLYAVKALDQFGVGFVSDIAEGIDWCVKNRMDVINMSFGLAGESRVLREAVARARRKGILMTASAGNDGPNNARIDAPARYPGVLGIAATTKGNRVASFSSRGKGIALAAPGVNILSTAPGRGYVRMSGTSMSSPHAAGGAALLRSLAPAKHAACIARKLVAAAKPLPGGRRAVGAGLLQVAPAAAALRSKQARRARAGGGVRAKRIRP